MNELDFAEKNEKTMTTKEVAEALNVSIDTIQNACKKLQATSENFPKFSQGQRAVYNEAQVTAIKLELQSHSKVNALSPKTTLEKQLLIQQAMQLQAEMIAELQAENEAQKQQLAIQAPKAKWFDDVADSCNLVEIGTVGKMLGIGQNNFFAVLKINKVIYKKRVDDIEYYLAYSEYEKYFKSVPIPFKKSDGTKLTRNKLMFTQDGAQWAEKRFSTRG